MFPSFKLQNLSDVVSASYRTMPLAAVLKQPVSALLAISLPEAAALESVMSIRTVFDLATSSVFSQAEIICKASNVYASHGAVPNDIIKMEVLTSGDVRSLPDQPISLFRLLNDQTAKTLGDALNVRTIRDVALYSPFQHAKAILTAVYFPESAPGTSNSEQSQADLVPRTGEYPTEKVQYTRLLLETVNDTSSLVDVTGTGFQPVDFKNLNVLDGGFTKVGFGALLTFTQAWYTQGLSLGQLLHSTSLAPGESTRVVVIDWSRRTRGSQSELISEAANLEASTDQNRSISEVTHGVANELQYGSSRTKSNSRTEASATSAAGEISAPLGGLFGGASGSVGGQHNESTTAASADTYTTSFGQREIAASMNQEISDRTHQQATEARSRRASVVMEVSQSEHEQVSTRVIANYNHMHALNIQYYEVVQIYRVEVSLAKVERVVYVPFKISDFDDAVIRRFQVALARAALSPAIRDALLTLDSTELVANDSVPLTSLVDRRLVDILRPEVALALAAPQAPAPNTGDPAPSRLSLVLPMFNWLARVPISRPAVPLFSLSVPLSQQITEKLWDSSQIATLSARFRRDVVGKSSNHLYIPSDCVIEQVVVGMQPAGTPVPTFFLQLQGGTLVESVSASVPADLHSIAAIGVTGGFPDKDAVAKVTITMNRNGVRFPLSLPDVTVKKGTTGRTKIVNVKTGVIDVNLRQHLLSNRLHYTTAIASSLNPSQLAFLFQGLGINIAGSLVPLAQVVEPRPLRFIANYLAFKLTTVDTDEEWSRWLKLRGLTGPNTRVDLVPLPSGGTFAEAVLGRSNCAEKLDITRFWNWQDSPIPLVPTEIAAVQTGSRSAPTDLTPGQLSQPIINMVGPAALPTPTSTGQVLTTLGNGNMFRDMSGVAATVDLAKTAIDSVSKGAATAGQQSSSNMGELLKANTERSKAAAQMIASLAESAAAAYTGVPKNSSGGKMGTSTPTASTDGAKINYFDSTKSSAPPSQPPPMRGVDGGSSGPAPNIVNTDEMSPSALPGSLGPTVEPAVYYPPQETYTTNPAALTSIHGDTRPWSDTVLQLASTTTSAGGGTAPVFGPSLCFQRGFTNVYFHGKNCAVLLAEIWTLRNKLAKLFAEMFEDKLHFWENFKRGATPEIRAQAAHDLKTHIENIEQAQGPTGKKLTGLRPLLYEVEVRWSQGCCNDPKLRMLPEDVWSFATREAPRQVPENAPESSVARKILDRVGEGGLAVGALGLLALGVAAVVSAPVAATAGLTAAAMLALLGDDGPNA